MAKKATRRVTRKASKPKAPKRTVRKTKRVIRKSARKASKPKAPKRAARKAKKTKRVTKKMQTGSMRQVWNGTKVYTKGGLMKKDLCKTKKNKVCSKKMAKRGQELVKNAASTKWLASVTAARKELNLVGFVKINRGEQGVALYKRAKELYTN